MEVYLDIFRRSLMATTKKGRQLFWQEKVHPRQNPSYAYELSRVRAVSKSEIIVSIDEKSKQLTTVIKTHYKN